MKTILVTGSNGLLGQKIIYALRNRSDVKCISTSRGENRMRATDGYEYISMDISELNSVGSVFEKYKPDVVINTAEDHCSGSWKSDRTRQSPGTT